MQGLAMSSPPVEFETTRDGFHRGAFHLTQPKKGAHRAGLDAMLLAACLPEGFDGHLADLGAGAGAVAFAALARLPQARATLIENNPQMITCALASLADPANQFIAQRASLLEADIGLTGTARHDAGIADNTYDAVLTNPPFNDPADRATPHEDKKHAHVGDADLLTLWIRNACAMAKPGGFFALIARPSSLNPILTACQNRFGALRLICVHPREGEAAIRILLTGVKGSRERLAIMPPLVVHGDGEGFTAKVDDLVNGRGGAV